MEQLTLNIANKSKSKIIASSAYNFRIELLEEIGKEDIPDILKISKDLSEIYGQHIFIDEKNIVKYFNNKTLPFLARYNNEIIGFIIGVPIEYFKEDAWSRYDINLNKNNTLYTYAFIIKKNFRKYGGYAKTLKMIYINWAKKRGYKYVTGHVTQGITGEFSGKIEIIKLFSNWYGTKQAFEYYRRTIWFTICYFFFVIISPNITYDKK